MEINTNTLGPVEIDESRIITFLAPLPGMDTGGLRYALLDLNPQSPVKLLQSVETPHVCLLVGDPAALVTDYVVELPKNVYEDLGLDGKESTAILIVLTVLGDEKGSTTANLKAPIVINRKTFKAAQVVLSGSSYSMREPVALKKG